MATHCEQPQHQLAWPLAMGTGTPEHAKSKHMITVNRSSLQERECAENLRLVCLRLD